MPCDDDKGLRNSFVRRPARVIAWFVWGCLFPITLSFLDPDWAPIALLDVSQYFFYPGYLTAWVGLRIVGVAQSPPPVLWFPVNTGLYGILGVVAGAVISRHRPHGGYRD